MHRQTDTRVNTYTWLDEIEFPFLKQRLLILCVFLYFTINTEINIIKKKKGEEEEEGKTKTN